VNLLVSEGKLKETEITCIMWQRLLGLRPWIGFDFCIRQYSINMMENGKRVSPTRSSLRLVRSQAECSITFYNVGTACAWRSISTLSRISLSLLAHAQCIHTMSYQIFKEVFDPAKLFGAIYRSSAISSYCPDPVGKTPWNYDMT